MRQAGLLTLGPEKCHHTVLERSRRSGNANSLLSVITAAAELPSRQRRQCYWSSSKLINNSTPNGRLVMSVMKMQGHVKRRVRV